MTEIPYFGEKLAGQNYVERLGVYAIVSRKDNQELCLVQAPNGAFFLPGGEIEAGEDHEQALKRELIEELGAHAEIGDFLGQADEYFYSSHRDTYYHNPAFLYTLKNCQLDQAPLEDFNHLYWFDVATAIDKLKRGSHKWGVEQWLARLGK